MAAGSSRSPAGWGAPCVTLEAPEDQPILPGRVAEALAADSTIGDVMLIHCETTSGLLNPLPEIAASACARPEGACWSMP